jgi:hypothetical protein
LTTETIAGGSTTTACWCCGEERAEAELARLLCHDDVALCETCVGWLADRVASRRAGGALRRATPIFSTTDVGRALEHYRKLGFATEAYAGGGYGFALRDRVELHLGEVDRLDPVTNTSACYLHVADADALYAEWNAAGVAGQFRAPTDTDYGLREGAHVDADGNLLRFGSPLPDDHEAATTATR